MKKTLSILFFVLNITSSFSQDSSRFYETIDTLCAKHFYGRGYTNNGHVKTVNYLTQIFRKADKLERQKFDLSINYFFGDMLLVLDDDTITPCLDYIPLPQASAGSGTLDISFLDSVFFTSSKKIKKFLKKDISKCAIVYHHKYERKITDNTALRRKIYTESGAIIQLTSNETLKSFSPNNWMPPSFSMKKHCFTDQSRLQFVLKQKIKKINSSNVIATLKGTDTTLKEIIVCAHYDHVGGYKSCFIPGANDNATGVSMLLELYHYFKENTHRRSIRFIAFGGEEVGLVGSKYYVDNTDLSDIEFVLNLDLYGGGSKGVTVVNGKIYETRTKDLNKINADNKYVSKIKLRGKAQNSDHYYFSENGIPAFFIYSNGSVGGYHNIQDVPEELEVGYFNGMFLLLKDFVKAI